MYSIRRARKDDAKHIHDAHMNSIREVCSKDHTSLEISGWGQRAFNREQREQSIENNFIWVVEFNDLIEGYAEIRFREAEGIVYSKIFGLYLTSRVLGMGFGKKLLELMIDEAKKNNVKMITLESTITAHNFYKKFGFKDSGEQILVQIGGNDVRCFPMSLKLN